MRILYLSPGLRTDESVQNRIDGWSWVPRLLGSDVEIVARGLDQGSENSEGDFDDYVAGGAVVRKVMHEGKNFDGVVVGDTGDPFVSGLREYLDVPVVGPMESSLMYAGLLAHRFSVITPAKYMIPRKRKQIDLYGYGNRVASVRSINMSVSDVRDNPPKVIESLVDEAKEAVKHDGAQAVIMMCGFMVEYYVDVKTRLGFPVIDPIRTALKTVESLVRLNLSQSKILYPAPKEKRRVF